MVLRIVSKPQCPYCEEAKSFLTEVGASYEVEHLDPSMDPAEYARRRDALISETGARTFPFIFLEGKFIGGFRELVAMYETGRLAAAYAAHGVCIREIDF